MWKWVNDPFPLSKSNTVHVHTFTNKLRNGNKLNAETNVPVDLLEAAEDAGLRYVSDEQPGFSRRRKGEEFEYFDQKRKADSRRTTIVATQASRCSTGVERCLDLSIA